jgi:hypothetical protein
MLTPLVTKEEIDRKTSAEYHYSHPHHYYCPAPLNNDTNNLYHTHAPSMYDNQHYYSMPTDYAHVHEEYLNHPLPSGTYMPNYVHQQSYSPEEQQPNEILYEHNLSDQPLAPVYDYHLSPAFEQNSALMHAPMERMQGDTSYGTSCSPCYVSDHSGVGRSPQINDHVDCSRHLREPVNPVRSSSN